MIIMNYSTASEEKPVWERKLIPISTDVAEIFALFFFFFSFLCTGLGDGNNHHCLTCLMLACDVI